MRLGFVYHFNDRDWQGGRNYFSSLFSAVNAVAGDSIELVLLTGTRTETTLAEQFPFLEIRRTPLLDRGHPLWALRQLGRLPSSQRHDPILGRWIEQQNIDLLSHSYPLRTRGSRVRQLGWVPDFQFVHLPALWDARALVRAQRDCEHICRESDALVLSSHAALADLHRFAPWYDRPAHVLHFVSAPNDSQAVRTLASLQEEHNLPEQYLHLPNQFWTHKNHQLVVDALAILKAQGIEVCVVCTGATVDVRRPNHFHDLMQHCHARGVVDRFRVLGMVPYASVRALMTHAHAVVNPSRFEGWSTTVEEARTMGKQLLLSDIVVHREQAPTGTLFFGVDDPPALAAAMHAAWTRDRVEAAPGDLERDFSTRLHRFGQRYLQIARSI